MATFEKRIGKGGKTTRRLPVRRQDAPWLTKSFAKKVDSEQWARTIEQKLDAGEHVPAAEAHACGCDRQVYKGRNSQRQPTQGNPA